MALLEAEDITAHYGKVRALKGVSFRIEQGQFVGLIGPNGSGKSTLLDTISGLVSQWAGRLIYNGEDISTLTPAQRVDRGLIHCPERRHLFPFMSVMDNLLLGSFSRNARAYMDENLDFVFSLFPVLKEKQSDQAKTLSGGQAQMLALGRAILSNPRLLMLDEPMLGVAPVMRMEFSNALDRLRKRNISLLVAEQEVFLTLKNTEIIHVLQDGTLTHSGETAEYRSHTNLEGLYFCKKNKD
jgi:branched-chain amino acid transport system ATP-binding protein